MPVAGIAYSWPATRGASRRRRRPSRTPQYTRDLGRRAAAAPERAAAVVADAFFVARAALGRDVVLVADHVRRRLVTSNSGSKRDDSRSTGARAARERARVARGMSRVLAHAAPLYMSVLLFGGVGYFKGFSIEAAINYTVATIVSPRHAKTSKLARAGELALDPYR